MAKKKKENEIIGYVDANGGTYDTLKEYETAINQPVQTSTVQPTTQNTIRSVESTVNNFNNVSNNIKKQQSVKDNIKSFLTGAFGGDVINAGVQTGKGVLKFPEKAIYDPILQAGSSKYNPGMYITDDSKSTSEKAKDFAQVTAGTLAKAGELYGDITTLGLGKFLRGESAADKYVNEAYQRNKENIDSNQAIAQELIADDPTQKYLIEDRLGYGKELANGKTVQETLDENANFIKSNNLGGQIFESIGTQLPSMMVGANAGEPGSLGTMAFQSYGSGLEEAYNQGATREEANRFGLMTAAIETATEKMFAGVGGVIGKGPLDESIETLINDRIKNKIAAYVVNYGLDMLGEGIEEVAADLLNPIAKKLSYASDEELSKLYSDEDYLNDFLAGMLSAGVMKLSSAPIEIQNIQNQVSQENIPETHYVNRANVQNNNVLQENEQSYTEQQTPQNEALNEVIEEDIIEDEIENEEELEDEIEETTEITEEEQQLISLLDDYMESNNKTELTDEEIERIIEDAIKDRDNLSESEIEKIKDNYRQTIKDYLANKAEQPKAKTPEKPSATETTQPSTRISNDIRLADSRNQGRLRNQVRTDQQRVGNEILNQQIKYENEGIRNIKNKNINDTLQALNLGEGRPVIQKETIIRETPNIVRRNAQTNAQPIKVVDNKKVVKQRFEKQINNALNQKNSNGMTYLGTTTKYVSNQIKKLLGIDVSNRKHTITNNDIRHIMKSHGNQKIEESKGQLAITKEDIKNIPDIIENPDKIEKGTNNKLGESIKYIKKYNNDTTYVVEVIPDNSNKLLIKTMWKKPSTLINSITTPNYTAEPKGGAISSTSADNISQSNKNVKQTKEELGNSSFNLKEKQNEIIQKSNPRDKELGDHTWINSVDDIKTFKEALDDDDYESGNLTPDYTENMIKDALDSGEVTVYSSYPIEQGTFVTPSKTEAENYAGGDKVYSKKVPLEDVAWIDSLQGQYAKVEKDTINEDIKEDVLTIKATDNKGNKVDLKENKDGSYTKEVKPSKQDVMPDVKEQTLKLKDKNVSNFYSNITEKSKFITLENRAKMMDNDNLKYYDAITNKETLKDAMDKLNKNTEDTVGEFFAKNEFTPEDVATGWILVKRYQDAGNFEAMSNVIEKMREQGTKAGQTVQMYGILQRLTPEGMEYYSQKQLDNAYKKFTENKSKKQIDKYAKDFTLTAEEHQFIKDTMEKVQSLEDEDAKKVEVAKIVKMLSDKLPPEKGQGLKAWMRISMLGNPKTQVRNVAGNAIIQPVNWVGDIFSSVADKAIAKKTGVRTKGTTSFEALTKGTVKGFKESVRDAKLGIDTRDINLNRFEENIGAKPFYEKGKSKLLNTAAKALNKTNQILGNIMSGGDRIFYQGIYENSLANQMKLNKVDKPTQEMIDIATQEALSRTWNDSNQYTKSVLQIRNAMNKLNFKGYGLGDVLVPFAKTPANLTKAIVDYSPVGLTRSILQDGKNLKNSLKNGQYSPELQHKFADSLGKGVAGSILYIAAYALAKAGITTGASDDDKDVANFMRNTLGIQPYSVKIGNKSFTYDWAQPIAAPFAITADAKRLSEKENQELSDIISSAVNSASNILLEQSFLSSIQDVFNNYNGPSEAIQDQIKGLPARATPTFFKQIADMVDTKKRQTFEKGQSITDNIKNQVIAKLPEASKSLESQRDTLGREIEKFGGDENKAKYAFNVFLNPANTNKGKTSGAAEEIYSVYEATGDKTVMPRQVGYSENIGGTWKNLTAKERNELQKQSGEMVEDNVKELKNNKKYQSMSDEDKAAVINGIVNYSYAKAKSEVFDVPMSNTYKTADKKATQGYAISDYYVDRISKRK